jgi:hypothetical protein
MNPGTANNNERTGNRDPYFSWLLRQPKSPSGKLKSCDYDSLPELAPSIICDRCSLPVLLIEATRQTGFKATRYTSTLAKRIGVESFLVRHDGDMGTQRDGSDRRQSTFFDITRLSDHAQFNTRTLDGSAECLFIEWLERKFEEHRTSCKG